MKSHAIEIKDLTFRYEARGFELNIPQLSIAAGKHVAIVGPSGCGKTTLAYLISGIHVPSGGNVDIGQHSITGMTDGQRRDFRISNIGFIFQEFELLEYLRVEENIILPYLVNASLGLDKAVYERARSLAESVGLGDKLRRYPGELSQGEKQRLAICRALITDPSIIMADEPTGNLDDGNTDAIMELILNQARRRNATFVMITHEHHLLDRFDDVVDLAKNGGRDSV
jgi:ABC-type lipoprotein export system ATPase subunit